jgi:2-dehydro-3-deoxy-D-gluconate 5-dehydrogenase
MSVYDLSGRKAVVTGGARGLGEGMARALARAGAAVVIADIREDLGKATADALRAGGATAEFTALDVTSEPSWEQAIAQAIGFLGGLDILVNNAGLFRGGPLLGMKREDWQAVIDTHLTGSFLCAQAAAAAMTARGAGGKIINIGSMYSLYGALEAADYGSAKTGLLGLTRALAVELAPHGIQVNAILPGWHVTALTQPLHEIGLAEAIRAKTPAGRWGRAEDVVGAAVFLAAPASDFVTGAAIPVDGGYSIADRSIY